MVFLKLSTICLSLTIVLVSSMRLSNADYTGDYCTLDCCARMDCGDTTVKICYSECCQGYNGPWPLCPPPPPGHPSPPAARLSPPPHINKQMHGKFVLPLKHVVNN